MTATHMRREALLSTIDQNRPSPLPRHPLPILPQRRHLGRQPLQERQLPHQKLRNLQQMVMPIRGMSLTT